MQIINLLFAILILSSCSKDKSQVEGAHLIKKESNIHYQSMAPPATEDYQCAFFDHVAYFYNHLENELYFMQYDSFSALTTPFQAVKQLTFDRSNNRIVYHRDSTVTVHELGVDIYGIGRINEELAIETGLLKESSPGTSFNHEWEHGAEPIKCGCVQPNNIPTNCHHGGLGTQTCSVTDSALGGLWHQECTVTCYTGSVACCSRDNSFTYN